MHLESKDQNLNPMSYKKFFSDIAEECEVHPDLVKELIRDFYSQIRSEMGRLEHSRINLPNLGTFITRKKRLDKSIKRHKDMLGNLEKMQFTDYERHIPLKTKLNLMEKASDRIAREITNKKQWKNENK